MFLILTITRVVAINLSKHKYIYHTYLPASLVIEILHQQKFKVHVKMKIPLDVDITSHKYQIGFTKAIYLQTNS